MRRIEPAAKNPARPEAGLADRLLNREMMRDAISKIGLTGISGRRAILIIVTSLGLAFCPWTQAVPVSATLAWNPSPSASVVGYVILSSTDGTNYNKQMDAGTNTSWTVTGLQGGTTNFFEVSAYDANNDQSQPSNPVEFVAAEMVNTIAIQANPASAGSVSDGGAFATGSSVTVTATANSGYTFTNWTANGAVQSTSPSYTFTLVTNLNLVANFTAIPTTNTVVAQANPANAGSVSGGGAFVTGSSVTVMATANSGFTFANWTANGTVQSTSPSYTFTLATNLNLVANFTAIPTTNTVVAQANPTSAGSVSGGGAFVTGSSVTVTATANSGFTFTNWTAKNGTTQSASPSYTFTLATNLNLTANFTANPTTNTVAVQANPALAGSVSGGGSFVTGSAVTVTASANSGYTFTNWTANGTVQSASPTYTFTLAADLNLVANFTANSASQTTAPDVTTLAASAVTPTNATLNATADPNGSATDVYFEYGPTTAYGNVGATNTLASDLGNAHAVAQAITGLLPGTTLHFQAVAHNSLGTYFGGDLTLITPAAPPMLAAVPDQSVNVGSTLLVTNTVTEANVPPRQITFGLGEGAPAGCFLSPNGVFQWTPVREQGSTTNLITVWAVDDGTPALSNSVSFNVTVSACVVVTIGSNVVSVGQPTSVPVSLYTTVSLSNVSFSLATPAGSFTNWGAASGNAGMATVTTQASDPSQPQFNFAFQSGQLGASSLGTIYVEALPAATSAFVPLTITQIVATASGNTLVEPVFGQSGRMVLIASQPLLEATLTNCSNPVLTLYGNPGSNCTVMAATNLLPPITWTPLTNLTLITMVHFINPGPVAGEMEFFRVLQQ